MVRVSSLLLWCVVHRCCGCEVFVVVSAMRSGSTSLALRIASRGGLEFLSEVRNGVGWVPEGRDLCSDPVGTLEEALEKHQKAVVKVFPTHCDLHSRPEALRSVLSLDRACYVVLEREPAHRQCSLDWATQHGDWSIDPSRHERFLNRTQLERPPCAPEATPEFQKEHHHWYDTVRNLLHTHNIPFLDINADLYIQQSNDTYLDEVADHILTNFSQE